MLKVFILIFVLISFSCAAFEKKSIGARQVALSGAGNASITMDYAALINPAILAYQNQYQINMFYKNYYGIKDLNHFAIHANLGFVGIGITNFGNRLYSETEFAFGSAYKISESFSVGLSSIIYFLEIKNYSGATAWGLNTSLIYKISDQILFSSTFSNITEANIGEAKEAIPTSIVFGISYNLVKSTELFLDVVKNDRTDFEYRLAARLNFLKSLFLLTGIREAINSFSLGMEYFSDNFSVKYALDIHPTLNASHAIGINYVL